MDEPMMMSPSTPVTKPPRIGGGRGRVAGVVEHDGLDLDAADFGGREFDDVLAFGIIRAAERGRVRAAT
jgi:hypothetical protein